MKHFFQNSKSIQTKCYQSICTAIEIVLKKKTAKGTICRLQNLGKKTRKETHTKIFISVQKLQAKIEHGKYILSHV